MSFTLTQEIIDDNPRYTSATVTGRLDSVTSSLFEKDFLALFTAPGTRVLLDCSQLDYVASSGLRVILMAAKRAQAQQGKLVISHLQPQVHEVFAISGFLKILNITNDLAEGQCMICDEKH